MAARVTRIALCLAPFLLASLGATHAQTEPAKPATPEPGPTTGRVTGIGGVFIKAKDPKALAAWYRDVLGLPLQPWGGALLRLDAPQHPPVTTWRAFSPTSTYFAPSASEFMINYAVDDMAALLAKLAAKNVPVLKQMDDASGRFAWVMDPEGNKVELWEPKRAAPQ